MNHNKRIVDGIAHYATRASQKITSNALFGSSDSIYFSDFKIHFPAGSIEMKLSDIVSNALPLIKSPDIHSDSFKNYILQTANIPLPSNEECLNFVDGLVEDERIRPHMKTSASDYNLPRAKVIYLTPFPAHKSVNEDADFAPIDFEDEITGNISGFDIDYDRYISTYGFLASEDIIERNKEDGLGFTLGTAKIPTSKKDFEKSFLPLPMELINIAEAIPALITSEPSINADLAEAKYILSEQVFGMRKLIRTGRELYLK